MRTFTETEVSSAIRKSIQLLNGREDFKRTMGLEALLSVAAQLEIEPLVSDLQNLLEV